MAENVATAVTAGKTDKDVNTCSSQIDDEVVHEVLGAADSSIDNLIVESERGGQDPPDNDFTGSSIQVDLASLDQLVDDDEYLVVVSGGSGGSSVPPLSDELSNGSVQVGRLQEELKQNHQQQRPNEQHPAKPRELDRQIIKEMLDSPINMDEIEDEYIVVSSTQQRWDKFVES